MEHLLFYGNTRRLTEEELARAVQIDPSQIKGLGPSLDALMEMLLERKRKILATYETEKVQETAKSNFHDIGREGQAAEEAGGAFQRSGQARSNSAIWKTFSIDVGDDRDPFARSLVALTERLGEKYQVDELAAKYEFTGRQADDRAQGPRRSRKSWRRSTSS